MSSRVPLFLLAASLVVFTACGPGEPSVEPPPARTPAPAATSSCGAVIGGVDALLNAGKTFALGELHGTAEFPAALGVLACEASLRGPVVVGVELPAHATFDAFLSSDGGDAARAALLAAPAWNFPTQDGRTSQAMLGLVERVRALRALGRDVDLLAFDARETAAQTRDAAMAERVLERRAQAPNATFLLLMGNLHARKAPGGAGAPADHVWLAGSLAARLEGVISLDASYPEGTAWVCTDRTAASCGVMNVGATPHAPLALAVRLDRSSAYDGAFEVPALTASPPAR